MHEETAHEFFSPSKMRVFIYLILGRCRLAHSNVDGQRIHPAKDQCMHCDNHNHIFPSTFSGSPKRSFPRFPRSCSPILSGRSPSLPNNGPMNCARSSAASAFLHHDPNRRCLSHGRGAYPSTRDCCQSHRNIRFHRCSW